MYKLLKKNLLFILFAFILFFSCRKTEKVFTETESAIESKFFNEHASNDEYLQKITAYIRRQNDKYIFLEKMTGNIGFPYWDKSIVFETAITSTRSTGDSVNIVYIPFVRDSQNFVNASLIVETTAADTALKVLYDWEYGEYGFNSTASPNKWNAADIFHVFTRFTKEVFGYTDYRITDTMLSKLIYPAAAHGNIKNGNAIVKILPQASGQRTTLLRSSPSLCDQYNLCFDQAGDFALCPYGSDRCTTISADQGSGGGGTGGSSGSGGSGGGLGGLDGDGKSGIGWEPVPTNDELYFDYSNLENPIYAPEEPLLTTGPQVIDVPVGAQQNPPIKKGHTINRNNIEDMDYGYGGSGPYRNPSGIYPYLLNYSDNQLFDEMSQLFWVCTFFDNGLKNVGNEMIQKFRDRT